jgi:hypothetical protein
MCLINLELHNEDTWGSGGIAPPFFDICTRLSPLEKLSEYPLDKGLGGAHSPRLGPYAGEKNLEQMPGRGCFCFLSNSLTTPSTPIQSETLVVAS